MKKFIKCYVKKLLKNCEEYAKYMYIINEDKEYPVCDKCAEKLNRLRYLTDEDYEKLGR